MTAGWVKGLLRDPQAPRRASFLELFFDLVFVVALAFVSERLTADLTLTGAFRTLILLMAVWWLWSVTAMVTDLYNPESMAIKAMTIGIMFGAILMTAALPRAFQDRGLAVAAAYTTIHFVRGVFFAVALRRGEVRRWAMRIWFWSSLSAIPWIAGGLAAPTARGALWIVALAVDYVSYFVRYAVPRWGGVPAAQFSPTAEHLAERYHQFFIIALGDIILVLGTTASRDQITPARTAAVLTAFASAVLYFRMYAHCAGTLLYRAIEISANRGHFARSAPYTHLFMVAGVVTTAAGAKLVISHPMGQPPPGWAAVILGGPALFLAGRARFEHEIFGRITWPLLAGLGLLVGLAVLAEAISPAGSFSWVSPLLIAAIADAVLAGIVILYIALRKQLSPLPPAPPL